jgi:hypothetical protein
VGPECINYFVEPAVQDTLEIVFGESDPMISHPALGKVVGAYFLAAVAAFDL